MCEANIGDFVTSSHSRGVQTLADARRNTDGMPAWAASSTPTLGELSQLLIRQLHCGGSWSRPLRHNCDRNWQRVSDGEPEKCG